MLNYTEDQLKAIKHRNGNLLILACAGSGKTEVISYRIASLVKEGIQKKAIIAFTFTDRAANELKARIRKHLEELKPDDPAIGDMYVGTIHSFCLQLLKEIDPAYRNYEVMDEARQAALIMTNYHFFPDSKSGIGLDHLRSRTRTGGYWDTVRTFATSLNVVYQKGIPLSKIKDQDFRVAIERYQKIAYGSPNYFYDFDRIISELLDKLKSNAPELEKVRSRFKHLVVDEYQDVDDRQEELIQLISDKGRRVAVAVVGDDDQAIYGWRGARIDNILKFENKYPNVERVTLRYNLRSTHAIVDVANASIRIIPPGRRSSKDMEARHWDDSTSAWVETMAETGDLQMRTFPSDKNEAEWVASRIKQLLGTFILEKDGNDRAIDFADMAILLRSVRSSGQMFADVLEEKGIPVVVKGTGGLFDHVEVLLVQASFCLLARTDFMFEDSDGQQRLDEPKTRDFIRDKIRLLRDRGSMPHSNEAAFLEWIAAKREELDRRNLEKDQRGKLARRIYPQDIFQELLKKLGIADGKEPWPQDVLFNLGRLSGLITEFEAVHQWITPKDLQSLCMFLGGWAAGQVDEGRIDEAGTPNAVQIMTVHAAKGLEWPVVFVPRVSSMNFPSNYRNRGPETFLDENLFNSTEYAGGDDGERRLWYVALTRCRKFLNISSQDRPRKRPTEYFKEVHHHLVQKNGDIADREKGDPTPPANVELLPTTFTDLSYFWRCPFEYQLRALMGFGPGVSESYGYGQQIHNILAEVHKRALDGAPLNAEEVLELMEKRFHLRYTRDGDTFKPLTDLRKAAKLTLRRYLDAYPEYDRFIVDAEKPFELVDQDSGALISGSIDLLQHIERTRSGELRTKPVAVVDFKTHRWTKAEDFFRKSNEVTDQLRIYALAVRKALGFEATKARAHFLSTRAPSADLVQQGVQEMVEVDVSPKELEKIREKIRQTVTGIQDSIKVKHFELKGPDTGHCPRCDFLDICPGYKTWDKKDRTTPRPLPKDEARAEEMLHITDEINARETSKQ